MADPGSNSLNPPAGRPRAWVLVAAMTLAALLVRLHSIDFALPYFQESDPHIFEQVELLRHSDLDAEQIERASIYPHLLARTVLLFDDPLVAPANSAELSLAEHLEHAGGLHVLVRTIVACFSALLIPATWLLARRFFDTRWALFATALSATSLLALQFGQMARPHGFAAPLAALAVVAAVRLRHRSDLGSFVLVGLTVGLALAALQSALAVLIPFAVALVLRDRAQQRWLEPRVFVTLGIITGFIRIFWPFAFGESSSGDSARIEDGTVHLSAQTMSLSEFTGEGFRTVWMTFWYYETVAFVLGALGLAWWCARALRGQGARGYGRDLLVVLSYAVPYTLVVGLHERAQQRFVIQLVPFVACAAAYGLRAIAGRFPRPAIALALAVPLIATARFAWLRAEGHTLGQAAAWIEAHVDPETERIGVHLTYDLPFARRAENLFADDGEWRKGIFTPWQFHQVTVMGEEWPGERRFLHSLYVPAEVKPPVVQADPEAYLRGLDLDYVVLPGEHGASFHPMLQAVRAAAANIGTLVFKAPRGERMVVQQKIEGLDTPHYTAFVLTSPGFGPSLEIYRLGRKRSAQRIEHPTESYAAPSLAIDETGAALLVSSSHDGTRDQLCAWFQNPGGDWGARLELSSGEGLLDPCTAALPGGGFVVCWSALVDGDWDVFAVRGDATGFGVPERVSERVGADTQPTLDVATDGTIWVAWQGVDGARTDLFAARSGAAGWAVRRVTDELTSDIDPSLAIDAAGGVWLAWSSWRHGTYADGNYEIHVERIDEPSALQRVTNSSAADLAPTLVALGDDLALAWTESYFPTRRNGILATVGYDRWADKVYRVARSQDGVFAGSTELRLTDNANKGVTVSDRASLIAAPDGERLWLFYGQLAGDLLTGYETRATVIDPEGAAEPQTLGRSVLGPGGPLGVAWRGDELLCAQVGHAHAGGDAERPFLDVARVDVRPDPAAQPLLARGGTPRKALVEGLFADQPERTERSTQESNGKELKAWFGNLHLHSDLSRDARGFEGSPAMNFQVVYDLAELDFAGLSDHAEALLPGDWWEVRKVSDLWNRPGVFVTLPGYEWTSLSYGHRNVFFPDTHEADAHATFGALGPDGERTPDDLWAHLDERRALTIPHHLSHALSKPTDWSFHRGDFERLAEVFQVRGNYEYDGAPYQKRETQVKFETGHSLRAALEQGLRLGIIASPDHGGGMGLAGVWAEELTRESIFEALHARRTFGTTGAKMTLWLEIGRPPQDSLDEWGHDGSAWLPTGTYTFWDSAGPLHVRASVRGTVPGLELTLVRDGEEVHRWSSDTAEADVEWVDEEPWGGTRYWYLRAEQSDGHLGWTSPVWIESSGY